MPKTGGDRNQVRNSFKDSALRQAYGRVALWDFPVTGGRFPSTAKFRRQTLAESTGRHYRYLNNKYTKDYEEGFYASATSEESDTNSEAEETPSEAEEASKEEDDFAPAALNQEENEPMN